VDVIEVHQQMTSAMTACQTALLDLINACINELKRSNPSVSSWEGKSRESEKNEVKAERQRGGIRKRVCVYLTPSLEPCPKWESLREILAEIAEEEDACCEVEDPGATIERESGREGERNGESGADVKHGSGSHVLICAEDDRTCNQLREFLCEGSEQLMNRHFQKYLLMKEGHKNFQAHAAIAAKIKNKEFGNNDADKGKKSDPETLTLTQMMRASKGDDYEILSADIKTAQLTTSKDAYYGLINSPMTILHPLHGCSDPHGITRVLNEIQPKYVVLYDADMSLVRQLEVGDYILTPDICVERKSVSDLIGSLNSGRLYQQALSMCRFYKRPMLLIEFDATKPFSLQAKSSVSGDISLQDVTSKLAMLTMHFPKLRLLWCPSPYATAELFEELKAGRPQPSAEIALSVTATTSDVPEWNDKYNHGPQDFVLRMPGINSKNFRSILNKFTSLYEMSQAGLEKLTEVLGSSVHAQQLHDFLHKECNPETSNKPAERKMKGKPFPGKGRGFKRKKK
ncbi:DNA repair endonuclease xpf, partial [Plakobranchus ocellatus]